MPQHQSNRSWLATATQPELFKRSLKVSLVVGTLLALINHGDRLLDMSFDVEAIVKIALTYLVPFSVSTWASVQTARSQANG